MYEMEPKTYQWSLHVILLSNKRFSPVNQAHKQSLILNHIKNAFLHLHGYAHKPLYKHKQKEKMSVML